MAKLVVYGDADFNYDRVALELLFEDDFRERTATRFTIELGGGDFWVVHGRDFRFSGDDLADGVVTGLVRMRADQVLCEVTDLSVSASSFSSGFDPIRGGDNNTIIGGNGSDSLAASSRNDLISLGAGHDKVFTSMGDDTVSGGDGDDTITDMQGSNYLRGDAGRDSIEGGSNFDDINGNMGDDTLEGESGNDWVVGGKDNDLLFGDSQNLELSGDGEDLVYGNLGDDTCDGSPGNDTVRGGQGNDVVRGGDGNDFVSGDRGDDTMVGGAGADDFHSFGETGLDRVTDFDRSQGDRVRLDPGTQFTASQVGADTVIEMVGGVRVVLVGVTLSSLSEGWIFVG